MTDQINRDRGDAYQAYSLPQDEETAVMRFEARYGHPPENVLNVLDKYLLVGPVEDIEHE